MSTARSSVIAVSPQSIHRTKLLMCLHHIQTTHGLTQFMKFYFVYFCFTSSLITGLMMTLARWIIMPKAEKAVYSWLVRNVSSVLKQQRTLLMK
jgi:antibiotic biosynthesis monooxygenase (ABM) superfamily enzyme